MNARILFALVPALVITVGCAPLGERIIGRWSDSEHTWDFKIDGTFTVERGLLSCGGTYRVLNRSEIRLEFSGLTGFLFKLAETSVGPKQFVVTVLLAGNTLVLKLPDGKELTLKRS